MVGVCVGVGRAWRCQPFYILWPLSLLAPMSLLAPIYKENVVVYITFLCKQTKIQKSITTIGLTSYKGNVSKVLRRQKFGHKHRQATERFFE